MSDVEVLAELKSHTTVLEQIGGNLRDQSRALGAVASGMEIVLERQQAAPRNTDSKSNDAWMVGAFLLTVIGLLFAGLYNMQASDAKLNEKVYTYQSRISDLRAEFTDKQFSDLDKRTKQGERQWNGSQQIGK